MRIEKLTLCDFRGYRGEHTFHFDGNNVLVTGGNGCGKSTLLEAIEYLLGGQVKRLHGSGTQGITTSKHLPHRHADPDDVFVEARFRTADDERILARRAFTGPGLQVKPNPRPAALADMQRLVEHDLHKLTRADIVDLVVSVPSERRKRVDQLLDIGDIETRRKQVKRLRNHRFIPEAKRIHNRLDDHRDTLQTMLEISEIRDDTVLEAVNDLRAQLNAPPLVSMGDWQTADFRHDVTGPDARELSAFQRTDVAEQLEAHLEWFDETEMRLEPVLTVLQKTALALDADEARASVATLELLQQGETVVGPATTKCPLCGSTWNPDALTTEIKRRQERLDRIAERRETIERTTDRLVTNLRGYLDRNELLQTTLKEEIDEESDAALTAYGETLSRLLGVVESIRDGDGSEADQLSELYADLPSEEATMACRRLTERATDRPAKSRLEDAWQTLGVVEDHLRNVAMLKADLEVCERGKECCSALLDELVAARDDILDDVYDRVETSFEAYYASINPDEHEFEAQLEPTDAGLQFRVGFYGDELHPPHAMHSEGHQDLMGICLFLALSRELSDQRDRFVLLDDVVMSIDEQHRDRIADLLTGEVSEEFQIVITTHDEVWAHMLSARDAIDPDYRVDIGEWTIDTGPAVK